MAFPSGVKTLAFLSVAAAAAATAAVSRGADFAAAQAAPPCYVAFLRPDPAHLPLSVEDRRRIQGAHMANIQRLADEGTMAAAGPMEDRPATISGIFIFR